MTTIAVVGMGAMGAGIAARLVKSGASVLTDLKGRSEKTIERARMAGVKPVTAQEMIAGADIVLSIIPPGKALETGQALADTIAGSDRRPMVIDCNAIAPQTCKQISAIFDKAGLPFGDGSIIGAPPRDEGPGPRLYLSGPLEQEAEILRRHGLDARVLSAEIGDASTLKMSYAGITKGFQALGTAMALGAARKGALDSLVSELEASQPHLYAWLCKQLPGMYDKAYRWDDEMREISKFLEPEAGSAGMLTGAADLYEHVASDNAAGPDSEIISTLNRFVGARS
jgi:3-hydroxyisobutyrate dehydrogenase-like beta-hydroxyacid dehydrogenase